MSCSRCNYSKWVVAQHKITKHVYGFRCGCESVLSQKIPQWNDILSKTYETDFVVRLPQEFKAMAANDKPEPEKVDDYEEIPF